MFQELLDKAGCADLNQDPNSADHIRWHFIGHLQSNKCKQIARIPNLSLVESIDSVNLASELNRACVRVGRVGRLPVLIQVNTSGEASKFGCAPEDALNLFGHVVRECPNLHARGLMTIGRLADTPQPDCFDLLVDIRKQILEAFKDQPDPHAHTQAADQTRPLIVDPSSFEMSMGMSGDYEMAIERGATIIRVGSTIFGAREYPQKKATAAGEQTSAPAANP